MWPKTGPSQDHILPKYCPSSSSKSAPPPRLALLVYNWSRVLHEVVDQHWPGALQLDTSDNMTCNLLDQLQHLDRLHLLIIVSKVVIHSGGEVEEQIPSVLGDRPVVVLPEMINIKYKKLNRLLPQKCAPQPKELESTRHNNVPVSERHFQVETLLTWVLGVVEGELVELLELVLIVDLLLQTAELLLELVDGIAPKFRHPSKELLPAELALRLSLELPGNDEHL